MAFYSLMLQCVFPKTRDSLLLKHSYFIICIPVSSVLPSCVLYSIFYVRTGSDLGLYAAFSCHVFLEKMNAWLL